MTPPLGKTHKALLRSMITVYGYRHGGSWYDGCGWVWWSTRETTVLMEALWRRGLVDKVTTPAAVRHGRFHHGRDHDRVTYSLTEAGLAAAHEAVHEAEIVKGHEAVTRSG